MTIVSPGKPDVNPILKRMAITRFESEFRLEGELVGKGRVKVSKKGAVTYSLLPIHSKSGESLSKVTGITDKVALEAMRQQLAGSLKADMGVLASRLTSDKQYEGGKVVKMPDGTVGMTWKPVNPEVLTIITPEQAMKVLGIDPNKWNEVKSLAAPEPQPAAAAPEPEQP